MACRLAYSLTVILWSVACAAATASEPRAIWFEIAAQPIADALDRFSEQSGLQIVYDATRLGRHVVPSVSGEMPADSALDSLLTGSGLRWIVVNENTILITVLDKTAGSKPGARKPATQPGKQRSGSVTTLDLVEVMGDPHRVLPIQASTSAFGFSKPLLETPRSVSFISEESVDQFGLSAVEDLVSLAPGVFTTTRFGIQGAVDVRNVPADTYFRGMKRLTLQGHGRSVMSAMDSIEVVRGPPSPIDGMGKVGGFTNFVPKSGRARLGGYLQEVQGFAQLVAGAYDRRETSFGIGGPLSVWDRQGGFYTYALLEDSESFTRDVPIKQKVMQAALSIEDFAGRFRLETGADYQLSGTSGALLNRVTQDLVDRGRYIRGTPLAMLDLNSNGKIGYLEQATSSPVQGDLSAANQPLIQRWLWPRDAHGNPLPIEEFPQVPGIPQSLFDYLVAACSGPATECPDPGGLLRAEGAGGPLPVSGYVPIGFALDPRTVAFDTLDLRRAGAYEREIEATFVVGYLDLIYDEDPDFTLKNQLFVDTMDQYKLSEQPSGGKQDVAVWADKLTVTYRWRGLPSWLRMNTLASAIFRNTRSSGQRLGGDYSSHRTDVMSGRGEMTPNTTFVHPLENPNLYQDGASWSSHYDTEFWEMGVGLLFDIALFDRTNVLAGARIDSSRAKNTNHAGTFDPTAGAVRMFANSAHGSDQGTSWSISISHEILPNVRPYLTLSVSSLTLDNNNNSLNNSIIRRGHIGAAELKEAGIKASLFDGKFFFSTAAYEQLRTDGSADDPSALLNTDVSYTTTRGLEAELKWVPSRDLSISIYGLAQQTTFTFDSGANILVDARALGFRDVVDADGNVVYPAEAFLYGGRAFLTLPTGMSQYEEKQGNPNVQFGLSTVYHFGHGLGFTLSGNYFSSVHSGRLRLVELPHAYVLDAGLFLQLADWRIKFSAGNVLNERYFRARTGDTLGDTLIQAMPARTWQLTVRYEF